uniref:Uncharacterized protein n=1 Tax=Arundo donax TaxID=35708 RepID=A0A0A8ZX28_ARUDO
MPSPGCPAASRSLSLQSSQSRPLSPSSHGGVPLHGRLRVAAERVPVANPRQEVVARFLYTAAGPRL